MSSSEVEAVCGTFQVLGWALEKEHCLFCLAHSRKRLTTCRRECNSYRPEAALILRVAADLAEMNVTCRSDAKPFSWRHGWSLCPDPASLRPSPHDFSVPSPPKWDTRRLQTCPKVPHRHRETVANTVEIHSPHGLDSGLSLDLDPAASRALEPSN